MNGQGSGSTETGAYTLNGATSGIILANAGAQVYIPTEDEWYKAAYYNAASQTYSLYPNGQNNITTSDANFNSNGFTNVGSFGSDPSSYGTFDQGGNVWEWNDAVIHQSGYTNPTRGIRGGSAINIKVGMSSTWRTYSNPDPTFTEGNVGFRLASISESTTPPPSIPEASTMLLTMFAGGMALIRRKR